MKEKLGNSERLDKFSYFKTVDIAEEEIDIYLENLSSGEKMISNISHLPIKDSAEESNYKLLISRGKEFFADYKQSKKELHISGNDSLISDELEFILYTYSEIPRNEKGRFTFHAAAVAKNNEGILILGDKGVGKTSLALSLCRDYGYQLVGNDVLILGKDVDGIKIYKGDGIFRLRKLSVEKYFGELTKYLENSKASSYDHKISMKPEQLTIDMQKKPVGVKSVVQVFLNADESIPLEIGSPPQLQLKLNLIENASRYIRAMTTPVLEGEDFEYKGGLPSFDRPELFQNRATVLERLTQEPGVISVSGGNLNEVASYVDKHYVSK